MMLHIVSLGAGWAFVPLKTNGVEHTYLSIRSTTLRTKYDPNMPVEIRQAATFSSKCKGLEDNLRQQGFTPQAIRLHCLLIKGIGFHRNNSVAHLPCFSRCHTP